MDIKIKGLDHLLIEKTTYSNTLRDHQDLKNVNLKLKEDLTQLSMDLQSSEKIKTNLLLTLHQLWEMFSTLSEQSDAYSIQALLKLLDSIDSGDEEALSKIRPMVEELS